MPVGQTLRQPLRQPGRADLFLRSADVIADAVSDTGTAVPALALAGEERAGGDEASSSNQSQQSQGSEQAPEGPDVDELAESVYLLLKRRFVIERERDFA